jgi:hypothetical protein
VAADASSSSEGSDDGAAAADVADAGAGVAFDGVGAGTGEDIEERRSLTQPATGMTCRRRDRRNERGNWCSRRRQGAGERITSLGILIRLHVLKSLKELSKMKTMREDSRRGRQSNNREELFPVGDNVVEKVQPQQEVLQ